MKMVGVSTPSNQPPLEPPMTFEQKRALLRMPITRGILAVKSWGGKTSAGNGERPSVPVLGSDRQTRVGTRARQISSGPGLTDY